MRPVGFCLRMPPLEEDGRNLAAHRAAWENLCKAGVKNLSITAFPSQAGDVQGSAAVAVQKSWLEEFGFSLSSIHYHGPSHASPGDVAGQGLVRRGLVEFVRKHAVLGPYAIVLHAGGALGSSANRDVFNAFKENRRVFGAEKMLSVIAENISAMADAASGHGIRIAVENMGRLLPAGDMKSLEKLIALAGRWNVGFCVDSGHAHCCGEDVSEWLEFAGARLFETHFHDNNARAAGLPDEFVEAAGVDEHLFPGLGTIDWRTVAGRMDAIGYKRPVMFECAGLPAPNPVDGYRKAVEWWTNLR